MCLLKSWFFDLQKNISQKKTINARSKQGQFWNLHQIRHKTSNPDFLFSSYFLMMEDFQIKLQLLLFSPEKKKLK